MRDENEGGLGFQPQEQIEKGRLVLAIQRRGRLVQQNNRILEPEEMARRQTGTRDLDRLALGKIVAAGDAADIDIEPGILDDLLRHRDHRPLVEKLTQPREAMLL